jgi:DNA invertase Pin-like site-specific DNA recombinase
MVKKERVDKTKNKIKVMKELLRDPLQTEREIAKNSNIAKTTVHRVKKEIVKEQWYIDLLSELDDKTKIISEDFKSLIQMPMLLI